MNRAKCILDSTLLDAVFYEIWSHFSPPALRSTTSDRTEIVSTNTRDHFGVGLTMPLICGRNSTCFFLQKN